MMIRYLPDTVLREAAGPVEHFDEELEDLVVNMLQTMYELKGIGLSAVQVGVAARVVVCHVKKDHSRVFVNPRIVWHGKGRRTAREGCLSVPTIEAPVQRAAEIRVEAQDLQGRHFTLETEGLLARVLQHELDHLDGVLFTDYLADKKRERLLAKYEHRVHHDHHYEHQESEKYHVEIAHSPGRYPAQEG